MPEHVPLLLSDSAGKSPGSSRTHPTLCKTLRRLKKIVARTSTERPKLRKSATNGDAAQRIRRPRHHLPPSQAEGGCPIHRSPIARNGTHSADGRSGGGAAATGIASPAAPQSQAPKPRKPIPDRHLPLAQITPPTIYPDSSTTPHRTEDTPGAATRQAKVPPW